MKKLIIFSLITFALQVQAQSLFKTEIVAESVVRDKMKKIKDNGTKRVKMLKSNIKTLNNIKDLSINIFDSITFTPKNNWAYKNENGFEVWAGVQESEKPNYFLMILKEGRITGEFMIDNRIYTIENIDGDIHALKEIDIASVSMNCSTKPIFPDSIIALAQSKKKKSNEGGKTAEPSSMAQTINSTPLPVCSGTLTNVSNNTFRIGFAYTPQFESKFPNINALFDQIQLNVELTNYTYANSLIDVRAVLAFAYKTPYNETISFDVNFRNFTNTQNILNDPDGKYDEVFFYRMLYKADICILLISEADEDVAGQADPSGRMALLTYNGAQSYPFTTAHEIGHIFGLEHNREEFIWPYNEYLDSKKAYGYLNTAWGWRTVMSYKASSGTQTRLPFYSDGDMLYNGQLRGNYYANAADYIRSHSGDVTNFYNVSVNEYFGAPINSGEIANIYGTDNVEISNTSIESGTRVVAHASQTVTLKPGFHAKPGSQFQAYIASFDSPPPPNLQPVPPAPPGQIKYIQGTYPFKCRGNSADFCIDAVPNATHYVWSASNTGISVTTSFNGRAAKIYVGPNANWTGIHTVTVTANNIYGASSPIYLTFGLNQYECGGGGTPYEPRLASSSELTSELKELKDSFDFYPNPANDAVNLMLTLKDDSRVKIVLTDLNGKEISKLKDNYLTKGHHSFSYPLSKTIASGVYIFSFVTSGTSIRKKIVIY